MKSPNRNCLEKKQEDSSNIWIIGIIILLLQLTFHLTVGAQPISSPDSIKAELNRQLNNASVLKQLNFPNTVKRFYGKDLTPNWLRPEENIQPTVKAMLLLDCVRQYGLQRKDYHPEVLNYSLMYDALHKSTVTATKKIQFELMLTDAMVSMINHLHYGAYNPNLTRVRIDNGISSGFSTEGFLLNATNSPNLMDAILTVQPQIDQYKQLQGYMKLIAGQYTCDSYETPEEEIRTISINMERLRWREIKSDSFLHINIPSFKLTYLDQKSTYEFKIVVGKPSTPTPTLASEISYLETGPDWNIPHTIFVKELLPKLIKNFSFFENNHMAVYDKLGNYIAINAKSLAKIRKDPAQFHAKQSPGCDNALGKLVFRFNNAYGIYLHDTPEQQYFDRSRRALSHGCIRVEHADELAILLLKRDNQTAAIPQLKEAISNYSKEKFTLKKPVPILITYLTITVENGLLARHKDVYKLDKILMDRMYNQSKQLTKITLKR